MPNDLDRAKQFLPFDALKGFQEIIHEQETLKKNPKILSEDTIKEIDSVLRHIKKGDLVEVIFYQKNDYFSLIGSVSKVLLVEKVLIINKQKIPFSAIISLKKLENFDEMCYN